MCELKSNLEVVAWMASQRRMPPSWGPSCMNLGGVGALAASSTCMI